MIQEQTGYFRRVLLVVAIFHVFATAVAALMLIIMTSGGGASYPNSPTIRAIVGVLQGLAIPMAWLVEHALNLGWNEYPFGILIALRLVNSLVVGALVAWACVFIRRRHAENLAQANREA